MMKIITFLNSDFSGPLWQAREAEAAGIGWQAATCVEEKDFQFTVQPMRELGQIGIRASVNIAPDKGQFRSGSGSVRMGL